MLRPLLFVGGLMFVLVSAVPFRGPHAQPTDSQATSLNAVKTDVLAATGYDDRTVELTATEVQFVVTIVNSTLISQPAVARENEARRIVEAIARSIANKPEFKSVQAIHIDFRKVPRPCWSLHGRRSHT
jgi:hypothetical protein